MADPRLRSRAKVTEAGCWEWQGARASNGYGRITVGSRLDGTRRNLAPHRLSYEQHVGPIPDGMFVCHTCDNPACVNPAHLFLGTPADNMADKVRKGRQARHESHGRAKLTACAVQAIREELAAGARQIDIAAKYGIAQTQVSAVKTGVSWIGVP